MADHLFALPSDHRLEEYEVRKVLSLGPYGIKYVCFDTHLNKQVAIKEYLPDNSARRADGVVVPKSNTDKTPFDLGLRHFLEEARLQSRLKQSNLAEIHRQFTANGTGYVVTDYVEGETLSAIIKRQGTLPEDQLRSIIHPILTPLEMMHDIGFLHQEISPGGIVVRTDGSPVLLDLGGSQQTGGGARQMLGDRSSGVDLTKLNVGFAALEQYSNRGRLGAWTDIYALGAVMYTCVTGSPPLDAPSRSVEDELVPAIDVGKGNYDEHTLAGIDKALAVQAGNRPPSIPSWRSQLLYGDDPNVDVSRSGHMARSSTRVAVPISVGRGSGRSSQSESGGGGGSSSRRRFGWLIPSGAALAFIAMLTYVDVGVLRGADGDEDSPATARAAPANPAAANPASGMVALMVRTEPAGVEVLIDDEVVGRSPLDLTDVRAGTYDVTLRHPLYETIELPEQEWAAGQQVPLERSMVRATGALAIVTDPPGAYIEIDGERLPSTTPTTLDDLPTGPLTLAIGAENYRQEMVDAEVLKNDTATVNLTLEEITTYGTLALALSPSDATVTLPNIASSYVPGMRLPEGEYPVTVSRQGYVSETRTVEIVGDVQLSISLAVDPMPFTIAVVPSDADIRFLASDREYSPGMRLVPGEYRMQAVQIGFETWEETIRHGNSATTVDVEMVPGNAEFADPLSSGGSAPTMVLVQSGDFRMGCLASANCRSSELPVRDVRVSAPFALSKYEVTFNDYDRFTAATGRSQATNPRGWDRGLSPVINVSWEDATAYAAWLTAQTGRRYRLPTEAEWEYAARTGSEGMYSWGNEIGSNQANCNGCGSRWDNIRTAPAGSFDANLWGLHDMHGNVWEWVQDCYHSDYVDAPATATARQDGDCRQRILRGGSWSNSPVMVRSEVRERDSITMRASEIGFRVAADAE